MILASASLEFGSRGVEIDTTTLNMILDGIDLGSIRRQQRYRRQPVNQPTDILQAGAPV